MEPYSDYVPHQPNRVMTAPGAGHGHGHDRPYRFSFYSNALNATIHARTLSELPSEGQSFEDLFTGISPPPPPPPLLCRAWLGNPNLPMPCSQFWLLSLCCLLQECGYTPEAAAAARQAYPPLPLIHGTVLAEGSPLEGPTEAAEDQPAGRTGAAAARAGRRRREEQQLLALASGGRVLRVPLLLLAQLGLAAAVGAVAATVAGV